MTFNPLKSITGLYSLVLEIETNGCFGFAHLFAQYKMEAQKPKIIGSSSKFGMN